ncbi:MAG: hypothetical protein HYT62_04240 [Candidatus Yanofskybacteria bacterium]|nr:hypothetical protein [Candidatus Yanofskybacteria bacterium]
MEHSSIESRLAAISSAFEYALRLEPDLPDSYSIGKDVKSNNALNLM